MLEEDLAQLILPYAYASEGDSIRALPTHLADLPADAARRLSLAILELSRVKTALVSQNSGSDSVAYPVKDGLGAMCITCVERHVASVLAKYGVPNEVCCRQFWPSSYPGELQRPPIHAYSVVELGGVALIVDIDADPFVGRNVGVVLAPSDAGIPLYLNGFVYHRRYFTESGQVAGYACYYERDRGDVYKYMEGDVAEYMTIAPYHLESDANLCPIGFTGGATLYFGFDKCFSEDRRVSYEIPLVLVCPMSSGAGDRVYQVSFTGASDFTVRKHADRGVVISIVLSGGFPVELHLSEDGCLVENEWVSFVASPHLSQGTCRARLNAGFLSRGPVKPSQAHMI